MKDRPTHKLCGITCVMTAIVLLWCICPVSAWAYTAPYLKSEVDALKALWQGLKGKDSIKDTWSVLEKEDAAITNTELIELTDVDWNADGEVTSIRLNSKQLSGDLILEGFSALTFANFQSNMLSGTLVAKDMPLLNLLWVTGTTANEPFTSVTLDNLPKLSQLWLTYAGIEGELDLSGFPELSAVDLKQNKLTRIVLDPSQPLRNLNLLSNQLTGTLDLSSYGDTLSTIICSDNQLDTLLLPSSSDILNSVQCSQNNLGGSLNLSVYPNMTNVQVKNNRFTDINTANLTKTTYFYCSGNNLSGELDVNHMPKLQYLQCDDNDLTSIKFDQLQDLKELTCKNNRLQNLEGLIHTRLYCDNNQITALKIKTNNAGDIRLTCSNNLLDESLWDDLDANALNEIDCSYNNFSSGVLDVEKYTKMTSLIADGNNLHTIKYPASINYKLSVNYNPLKSIDLSSLTRLYYLWCAHTEIEELDVSRLTGVISIQCQGNYLKELDLGNFNQLLLLNISDNQFTDLNALNIQPDILETLICDDNQFSGSIDLTRFTNLRRFNGASNDLTEVHLNGLQDLTYISVDRNPLEILNIEGTSGLVSSTARATGYYHVYMSVPVSKSMTLQSDYADWRFAENDALQIGSPLARATGTMFSGLKETPGFFDITTPSTPLLNLHMQVLPDPDYVPPVIPSKDVGPKPVPSDDIEPKPVPSKDVEPKPVPSKDVEPKPTPSEDVDIPELPVAFPLPELMVELNDNLWCGRLDPIAELSPGAVAIMEANGYPNAQAITYAPYSNRMFVQTSDPAYRSEGHSHMCGTFITEIPLELGTVGNTLLLAYTKFLNVIDGFEDWGERSESQRLALLKERDISFSFEFSDTVRPLVGRNAAITWEKALAAGIVTFTDSTIVLNYAAVDGVGDPFPADNVLVVPDGEVDRKVIDPIWLMTNTVHPTGFIVMMQDMTLTRGESREVTVQFTPSYATEREVMWETGNSRVAVVEKTNRPYVYKVTGLSAGQTDLKATLLHNPEETATMRVTVVESDKVRVTSTSSGGGGGGCTSGGSLPMAVLLAGGAIARNRTRKNTHL